MLALVLKWLGANPIGTIVDGLNRAHEARLAADNAEDKLVLDGTIKQLETTLALYQEQAGVIKTGMGHPLFWIPWSMAAIAAAGWFAWGVLDSAVDAGRLLPDVAALPPQLQHYFDIVWSNIFYTGAGVAGAGILGRGITEVASAIRGRK